MLAPERKLSLPSHEMPFRDFDYFKMVLFKKQKTQKESLTFPVTWLKDSDRKPALRKGTITSVEPEQVVWTGRNPAAVR